MMDERERRVHDRIVMAEIIQFLESDLYREDDVYVGEDGERYRVFVNPPGTYKVFVTNRCSGWIQGPDGKAILVSSFLDAARLDEYLP